MDCFKNDLCLVLLVLFGAAFSVSQAHPPRPQDRMSALNTLAAECPSDAVSQPFCLDFLLGIETILTSFNPQIPLTTPEPSGGRFGSLITIFRGWFGRRGSRSVFSQVGLGELDAVEKICSFSVSNQAIRNSCCKDILDYCMPPTSVSSTTTPSTAATTPSTPSSTAPSTTPTTPSTQSTTTPSTPAP